MNGNQRTRLIVFSTFATIIVLTPLVVYYLNFKGAAFSMDNKDWANFGAYMNGVLGPLIALTGALVTLALGSIAHQRNLALVEREEMTQRPLMHVYTGDYENIIRISMINKGLGVLVITGYKLLNTTTGEESSSFFDIVGKFDEVLENYTGDMTGIVLSPDEEKELFHSENPWADEAKTKFKKDHEQYQEFAANIRDILKNYKIQIEYTNIHGTQMQPYECDLTWYGRMANLETIPKNKIFT